MFYLSRRRRRQLRFWGFVLLLVWLLGVAAAHNVTIFAAYTAIALVVITVDLTSGRRHRGRRRRPARRARPDRTRVHRPGRAT
ncbi:hypothetical protein UK99_01620 [Frankia casuarinae]|uniref:hypothetical protein n=1 Tax=Frankia casuarinae (strain DSM 45818 / CECT 9043 / HFP020203 / CcI3) TaxID=106370 RepID=UPI000A0F8A19|nr:hypothetical protein [Frankia casuarinae]ORT98465.1 hypothetical protein UK99_01620 [Frankia casuarinae]